ncbi:class I SAM-dependent methyltransferase [Aliifodinibius sp. S!AR15-10]|uniref:class I SAM-dependent methyltransferase n=1 Tax=Aliifodinibius sp. S!AR15-10 TaxID=2950437 RepID=UPI00285847D3|nr:class I SAM-dependent methyltransferase [Aliifodinibius sp. S!AR15-10]MDR8391367.1 class I SAM-dependent methyltransferase [Aliifodinibius sp. S!AR15-10]
MEDIDPSELSRQLKKPSGEVGHEVAQNLNESNQKLYEMAWEMVDLQSVQDVLEIGFGNGKYLSGYFDFNPQLNVTGVDFSEEMCEEARAFHSGLVEERKLAIHCADSASMPVADGSVGLIVGINIVYFWDPPGPHLQEIHRVLEPGGKLLLGYRPRRVVEHLEFTKQNFILYEPGELEMLLLEQGFRVTEDEENRYLKQAPDGSDIDITDICVVAERT